MNKKNYKYYPLTKLLLTLPLLPERTSNRKILLRNKITPIITILLTLSSCIKPFSPKIKSSEINKYVVSGQVTAGAQTQTVSISMSSSIGNPTYKPVTGCKVTIQDNEHHDFRMVDLGNGEYSTMVAPQYLVPGHVFKVNIVTPSGDNIVSNYDTINRVPPVDSINYRLKEIKNPVSGEFEQGLQFYIDLKGNNADSRYYRWNIYETWEYHAMYPVEYYYDSTLKFHRIYPPDSSRFTCWDTRKIPKVFTLSTANLSQNKYSDLPLQYVNNTTPKLANGYSMLVEQIALSKAAYNYWYQMRTNNSQEGGLYVTQPVSIRGNLRDITHPNNEVLGFFSAVSASYKRIFISKVEGLTMNYEIPCSQKLLSEMPPLRSLPKIDFPLNVRYAYSVKDKKVEWFYIAPECVNCLLMGGDTIKPSFWPN